MLQVLPAGSAPGAPPVLGAEYRHALLLAADDPEGVRITAELNALAEAVRRGAGGAARAAKLRSIVVGDLAWLLAATDDGMVMLAPEPHKRALDVLARLSAVFTREFCPALAVRRCRLTPG